MCSKHLIKYPHTLNKIFDTLHLHNIQAIIIGGYVRDSLLGIQSKDIDIELYGVSSFEQLENILQEFGSVNNVGKSFGVCKLSLKNIDIDFTLPRRDNKIASGHKGFLVQTDDSLDFTTASSRRDFTMNAIGFDVHQHILLDSFNGRNDISKKIIRAVDLAVFGEDPLRVLRAVAFSSRLHFTLDKKLFLLCKKMCENNLLKELPKERIYEEIKKILLKSSSPSLGFLLLKNLNALSLLYPLDTLNSNDFSHILKALDRLQKLSIKNKNTYLFISLCVLCSKFTTNEITLFLNNLTNEKKLISKIQALVQIEFQKKYTDSDLLFLATKVNIELFLLYCQVIYSHRESNIFNEIKKKALRLNILHSKQKEFLQGRDIMALGIKPSKEYSEILSLAYTQQLKQEIKSPQEAISWLKKYLMT